MLNALPNWIYFSILPLMGGILYALGFPILGSEASVFVGPILGAALFFLSLKKATEKERNLFITSIPYLLFGFGYYQTGYYWIPYTIQEFGGIVFPVNFIFGVIFSSFLLPQYFIYTLWYKYVHPKYQGPWSKLPLASQIILGSFFFTMVEHIIPTQFPAHIGHAWLSLSPYLKPAHVIGAPGYSFFAFLTAATLAQAFFKKNSRLLILMIAPLALLIWGFVSPIEKSSKENLENLKLRMVQANIGNNTKLTAEEGLPTSLSTVIGTYGELSVKDNTDVDLVIWPETAYPLLLSSASLKVNPALFPMVVHKIRNKTESHLFFGGYDRSDAANPLYQGEYNTAFYVSPEMTLIDTYHKRKLIPFGEGLPFGPFNEFLAQFIRNISYFAEGKKFTEFQIKNFNFISVICYEILFTDFIRDYLNNVPEHPSFIINITNDSWYGDTAEPHQHLFLSKWRAIEFNIPIARSTNTGITSVVYPDGSESKRLDTGETNFLDVDVKLSTRPKPTVYQIWGLIPLLFIIGLLFGFSLLTSKIIKE